MPLARERGVELYYERDGAGDPVVLVHPLMTSLGYWEPFRKEFATSREAILYDCRGHGRSTRPQSGYTVDDHIADLAALIEGLELDRPALVGYSMGAYICLGVTVRHPELVSRVILAAAKPKGERASADGHVRRDRVRTGADAIDQVEGKVFAAERPDRIHVGFIRWLARSLDRSEVALAIEGSGGFDFERDLPAIEHPMLILHGTHDELNPIEGARRMATAIPNCRMVSMPGCGHECPMEAPEKFLAISLGFLAEHEGAFA